MTATSENKPPDFFNEKPRDPVNVAIGPESASSRSSSKKTASDNKRKAGFYLSVEVLDRFNRKFHELKLEGAAVENKSALLELAISFALEDMGKGRESRLLAHIMHRGP
ncbi:MAG: hypothetical protein PVI06_15905 [Desulfobacterales bacterium]|jgi:hypothetical protein